MSYVNFDFFKSSEMYSFKVKMNSSSCKIHIQSNFMTLYTHFTENRGSKKGCDLTNTCDRPSGGSIPFGVS